MLRQQTTAIPEIQVSLQKGEKRVDVETQKENNIASGNGGSDNPNQKGTFGKRWDLFLSVKLGHLILGISKVEYLNFTDN